MDVLAEVAAADRQDVVDLLHERSRSSIMRTRLVWWR